MSMLYVLSGSSACGKTTLMNSVLQNNDDFLAVKKYGTRRRRPAKDGIEDDVFQVFPTPIPHFIELTDFLYKNNVNLKKYYKLEDNRFILKNKLTRNDLYNLSILLEDLEIRKPQISIDKFQYWDVYGDKIIVKGCIDIAYALNKGQYGISTEDIRDQLKKGHNVITILSDFRIINRLKSIFNNEIVVIYVASAVDTAKLERIQIGRLGIDKTKEDILHRKINRLNSSVNIKRWDSVARWIYELNTDWQNIKPDAESTAIRSERIKTFHTRYVDNITLFDYTILNYNEGHPEDMTKQFCNILINQKPIIDKNKSPLFVVTAASNAGKGTMMEMLNLIGSDRVKILSKIAKRKEKKNDKNDGMLPIGKKNQPPKRWPEWPNWWTDNMIEQAKKADFPDEYDFQWIFKKVDHNGKNRVHGEYAVCDKEIKENLEKNKAQIVISNTDQIEKFIERYGDRVIFILLYRLSSKEDTKNYYELVEGLPEEEAEIRADEVDFVLQEYIKKIHYFSHVILNTTKPEDLYDQIFQLVEYYHECY